MNFTLSKQAFQFRQFDQNLKLIAQNSVLPGAQRNHTTRDALGMQDSVDLYGSVDVDFRTNTNTTYGSGNFGE